MLNCSYFHNFLAVLQIGLQNLNTPSSLWSDSKDKAANNQSQSGGNEVGVPGSSSLSGPHGWNVEVFIKALLEVLPNLNVKEIFTKLDHKGFFVKDRQGLKLLITALR